MTDPLIRVIAVGQVGAPDCLDQELGGCSGTFIANLAQRSFLCQVHERARDQERRLRAEQVRLEREEASRVARERVEARRAAEAALLAAERESARVRYRQRGRNGAAVAARNRRHRALAAWWPTLRGYS